MIKGVPSDKVLDLKVALKAVDRLDLFFKKEAAMYWYIDQDEELSIEGCVEFLLEKFPEKKVYERPKYASKYGH